MADVLSFMRSGWGNIWKQKTIWVFSALSILGTIFRVSVKGPDLNSFEQPAYLPVNVLLLILLFLSLIGVPYAAYCFSIGKIVDVDETLDAVMKFAWRMIGVFGLVSLMLLPFMCLVFAFSRNAPTAPPHMYDRATLLSLPLALFTGTWDFTMFELFANDRGIRESIKKAWELFTSHFRTLAILGIIMALLIRFFAILSGIFTVLIQSGFDMTALSDINYINPSATLGTSVLFVLMNGIAQIVITPFNLATFALAYVKYTGVKTSILSRQMEQ